ncbi:MAG TPA: allantoate amidohydrolase [Edaphobacter sp.]
MPTNTQRAEKVIARCRQLAVFTEVPGEITRTFLSPPMHDVHNLMREWMQAAGMSITIDILGNIRGLYPGFDPNSNRLLIGSHLDTVPNAGAFDGPLGVVLGIALVEHLHAQQIKLPFPIEVIGFSEEEGVRFSKPFLGSLGITRGLSVDHLLLKDANGISVAEALTAFGIDPRGRQGMLRNILAYLEFHIEQGPVLDSESASLAVVDTIIGQSRFEITFTGNANHAGTTPMHLRHDALAAAAEWIVNVETYAQSVPNLVATVGKIHAEPNAGNVVPGSVITSLDVRHANNNVRTFAHESLIQSAKSSASKRGVQLSYNCVSAQNSTPMNPQFIKFLDTAATRAGHPSRIMSSGAGHDAMILAQYVPAAMLFLRSPGGISHHPDETVLPQDVEAALATGIEFLTVLRERHISTTKEAHA